MASYSEVPYHNPSFMRAIAPLSEGSDRTYTAHGGFWTDEQSLLNLCDGVNDSGNSPSRGTLLNPAESCSEAVDGFEITESSFDLYVPETPVASLYIAKNSDRPYIEAGQFLEFKLRGSLTDTAYIYADVQWGDTGAMQSLIMDTGSSLTAFPCTYGTVADHLPAPEKLEGLVDWLFDSNGQVPGDQHIDPPLKLTSVDKFVLPCSLSCKHCLHDWRNLWAMSQASEAENVTRRWCKQLGVTSSFDDENRTDLVRAANIEQRVRGGFSVNSALGMLSREGTLLSRAPESYFPVSNVLNYTEWSSEAYRSLQLTSMMDRQIYKLSHIPRERGGDVNDTARSFVFQQWLLQKSSFYKGAARSRDGGSLWLFLNQPDVRRWQRGLGVTAVAASKSKGDWRSGSRRQSLCRGEDAEFDVVNSPVHEEAACAFEVSYMEGSRIRGMLGVSAMKANVSNGSSINVNILHGCTTLETHLFRNQKASGIMGMEPWPFYPAETFVGSLLDQRRGIEDFSICYSGEGGSMRFGSLHEELRADYAAFAGQSGGIIKGWRTFPFPGPSAVKKLAVAMRNDSSLLDPITAYENYPPLISPISVNGQGHGDLLRTPIVRRLVQRGGASLMATTVNYSVPLIGITMLPPESQRDERPWPVPLGQFMVPVRALIKPEWRADDNFVSSVSISVESQEGMDPERDFFAIPALVDSGTTMSHFPIATLDVIMARIDVHIELANIRRNVGRNLGEESNKYHDRQVEGFILRGVHEIEYQQLERGEVDDDVDRPFIEEEGQGIKRDWERDAFVLETRRLEGADTTPVAARDIGAAKATPRYRRYLQAKGDVTRDEYCWYLPRGRADLVGFPSIVLHFVGGVQREWSPEQYLYARGSEKWRCLNIYEARESEFQLGLPFFENVAVSFHFDVDTEKHSKSSWMNDNYLHRAFIAKAFRAEVSPLKNKGRVQITMSVVPALCPRHALR